MNRYEFNENPQVTMWRMKCEKLQKENETLKETCEWLRKRVAEEFEAKKNARSFYEEHIAEFNRLHWWEKMFYRFWFC